MHVMTQSAPAPVLPLFTRSGEIAPARVELNERGKPSCTTVGPCTRCGGQGGYAGWPGFTCYRCGGQNSRTHERHEQRLYTQAELDRMNATKAKRDAKRTEAARATADAEKAIRDLEVAARREAFLAQYGALIEAVRPLAQRIPFVADVLGKAEQFMNLSKGQAEALQRIVQQEAEKTQRAATSQHVGEVGKRQQFTATINKTMNFNQTAGYQTVVATMYLMTDAAGNVLKYTSANVDLGAEGETVTFVATVKDHADYNGVAQTVLTRAKLVEA